MNNKKSFPFLIFAILGFIALVGIFDSYDEYSGGANVYHDPENSTTIANVGESGLNIIVSDENKDIGNIVEDYARENDIDVSIEYAGTLDIMEKLNRESNLYDAVWASNSMWLYMLNSDVSVSDSKSISINPVVFAIRKSKAEELGFVNREIYTKDIVDAIKNGSLKFTMSNPTQTNSGATAYLGLLSTLAGNPEVLKEEHLYNETLKQDMISLFSGMERSSGSEEFLSQIFLKDNSYDAVVTYESSIIKLNENKVMEKDPLYALYPVDGVSISDSPFAYINHGNDLKKESFLKIRNYLLSDEGQTKLAANGRRTWYGGVNAKADKKVFNPSWGINTTNYIVPLKFPNTEVVQRALALYQSELRKPIHTVFCLDYSGSMSGDGNRQLVEAMEYILSEQAEKDLLQFTEKDKVSVIPFSTNTIEVWDGFRGNNTNDLLTEISSLRPTGSTNIYDPTIDALSILKKENQDEYNLSVILMTDGNSNNGSFNQLYRFYVNNKLNIPVFSIMFGNAYEGQLKEIAELTNAKIFDGKVDLLKAFKEVRGYN